MSEDLVNGRPVSDMAALREPAPDLAAAGKSSWDEYYAIADAAERRRVRAEVGRALVAAGVRLLGQPGLDRTDGVDDRVDDVAEDGAAAAFAEAARGANAGLLNVVDELVGDGQIRHGSPVDSSGGATPGAGVASPDSSIVASDGDSGPDAVPCPASGPLSPSAWNVGPFKGELPPMEEMLAQISSQSLGRLEAMVLAEWARRLS